MHILEYRRLRPLHVDRPGWLWLPFIGLPLLALVVAMDVASDHPTWGSKSAVFDVNVVDALTGKPISGASVEMIGRDALYSRILVKSSRTDRQGLATSGVSVTTSGNASLFRTSTNYSVGLAVSANGYTPREFVSNPKRITSILGIGPSARVLVKVYLQPYIASATPMK